MKHFSSKNSDHLKNSENSEKLVSNEEIHNSLRTEIKEIYNEKNSENNSKNISENIIEKKFLAPLREVFFRFPLAILLFVVASIFFSGNILIENFDENFVARITLSLFITGILSVGISLLAEKKQDKKWNFLQIFPILYGIFVYWNFSENFDFFTTTALQVVGFILSIFWVSVKKSENDEHFYNTFIAILSAMILAGFVGITSGILGMVAIGAIENLFDF